VTVVEKIVVEEAEDIIVITGVHGRRGPSRQAIERCPMRPTRKISAGASPRIRAPNGGPCVSLSRRKSCRRAGRHDPLKVGGNGKTARLARPVALR
jgi:hypothetical protein